MTLGPLVILSVPVLLLALVGGLMFALLRRRRAQPHRGIGSSVAAIVVVTLVLLAGLGGLAMLLSARAVDRAATFAFEDHPPYTYHSTRELTIESGSDSVGVSRIDADARAVVIDGEPSARIGAVKPPHLHTPSRLVQPPPLPPEPRVAPPIGRAMPPPLRYALSAGALALLIGVAYLFIDAPRRGGYTWLRRATWAVAFLAVCLLVWRAGLVFGPG